MPVDLQPATALAISALWVAHCPAPEPDTHAAFRATFETTTPGTYQLHTLGASTFRLWLDGAYLHDGPARFLPGQPEYQTAELTLAPGRHVLAVHLHHDGVTTRLLQAMPPCFGARLEGPEGPVALEWRARLLPGYLRTGRRLNPQLSWLEWHGAEPLLEDWHAPEFSDAAWPAAARAALGDVLAQAAGLEPLRLAPWPATEMASGLLSEEFGYALDDPPARFLLRDLAPAANPPQGRWWRFDLGEIGLTCPTLEIEAPAGTVIEIAYAETLTQGRVAPHINLSAGLSCNMDHLLSPGGRQTFTPLHVKGGRYVELHVLSPTPEAIRLHGIRFATRRYYHTFAADFACSDPQLDAVWQVGVRTLLASLEDAAIDNPTRERGQWIGDLGAAVLLNAGLGLHDLAVLERGLRQSAQCAGPNGMVAGLCPGDVLAIPGFACNWVTGCVLHHELTGRTELLEALWPAAQATMQAFARDWTPRGLDPTHADMQFIDWGYVPTPDGPDMGLTLFYACALSAWQQWCERLDHWEAAADAAQQHATVTACIQQWLAPLLAAGDWPTIGFHRAALAARQGLIAPEHDAPLVAYLQAHILDCFPNHPAAPRLSSPEMANPRLITPYFFHYVLPVLIERGAADFVHEQYRRCWGWALERGITTLLEVFDLRWSHCHPWAGCPTWQLSTYTLGLRPRFDLGENHFTLRIHPGALAHARGSRVLAGGGCVRLNWQRSAAGLQCTLECDAPVTLVDFPAPGEQTVITHARAFTV